MPGGRTDLERGLRGVGPMMAIEEARAVRNHFMDMKKRDEFKKFTLTAVEGSSDFKEKKRKMVKEVKTYYDAVIKEIRRELGYEPVPSRASKARSRRKSLPPAPHLFLCRKYNLLCDSLCSLQEHNFGSACGAKQE